MAGALILLLAWAAGCAPAASPTPSPVPTFSPTPAARTLSLGQGRWVNGGRIVDAAFMPDGSALAIARAQGVSLVDAPSGRERWRQPTPAIVIALAVHPHGEAIAAALEDGSVMVWNAVTGGGRRIEAARPYAYWGDLAWSPQGDRLAVQFIGPGRGDPIILLDPASGSSSEVPGSTIPATTQPYLAWSPDGTAITLSALGETCSRAIDVESGETRVTLQGTGGCASSFGTTWSPDGRQIAILAAAGVELLDARTGEVARSLEAEIPAFRLTSTSQTSTGHELAFSPDGTRLALKGGLGFGGAYPAVIWDVASGTEIARLDAAGSSDRMAAWLDGESLLFLYEHGEIARWPYAGPRAQETIVGDVVVRAAQPPLLWSADGARIAAALQGGGVAVWEVQAGRLIVSFSQPFDAPVLSPDGLLLAMADRQQGQEILYDLAGGAKVRSWPDSTAQPLGAAFSPDGTEIAFGSRNWVVLADIATSERRAVLTGHPTEQEIARIVWSSRGDALVTAGSVPSGEEGLLVLWLRSDGRRFEEAFRTRTVRAGYENQPLAAFNPSGTLVAMEEMRSGDAASLKVWVVDTQTREVVGSLDEYELAAWASDEVLMVSEAQFDTRLAAWNVRNGDRIAGRGRGSGGNVYAPGGQFYATLNTQGPNIGRGIEVRAWQSGGVVAQASHGSDVIWISWSPDGRWIAALGTDGTIRAWPVE